MTTGTTSTDHDHIVHKPQSRYTLPADCRQILLVRHGSSMGDHVDTLMLGDLTIGDPPLAPDGHVQAQAVAAQLANEPIAHIFITPLKRTAQTAAPLIAATGLDPVVIEDMREAHMGDWENRYQHFAALHPPVVRRMITEERWDVIPNAEPMEDFGARVRRGIEAIAAMVEPGATAVSFSHAATIAEICRQATNSRAFAFMAPENASISRLIISAGGTWRLRTFNEVAHLLD